MVFVMDSSSRLGYMPALDGLRAVAIVLVVASHAIPGFLGKIGVEVFFVLSGFLITALIADRVQSGDFSKRRFYARRAIRLVPALLVTVVVFAPIAAVVMTGEPTWWGALGALLYLTPFFPPTVFEHTWSLAVEEWFYLLWPLALGKLFRDRLTLRQCAGLVGTVGVLIQLLGISIRSASGHPHFLFVRPSALLLGCALALWWLDGGRIRRPSMALAVGLGMVLFGAMLGPFLYVPLIFWLAASGSVLAVGAVASGAGGRLQRVLVAAPTVAIGVVSYEWYLVHVPMLQIGHELGGLAAYWITIPGSLVVAFGLHYAVKPLQVRLRGRVEGKARTHDQVVMMT